MKKSGNESIVNICRIWADMIRTFYESIMLSSEFLELPYPVWRLVFEKLTILDKIAFSLSCEKAKSLVIKRKISAKKICITATKYLMISIPGEKKVSIVLFLDECKAHETDKVAPDKLSILTKATIYRRK